MRLAALHPPLCHLLVHPDLRLKVAADELSIAERDLRSTHKPIGTLFMRDFGSAGDLMPLPAWECSARMAMAVCLQGVQCNILSHSWDNVSQQTTL